MVQTFAFKETGILPTEGEKDATVVWDVPDGTTDGVPVKVTVRKPTVAMRKKMIQLLKAQRNNSRFNTNCTRLSDSTWEIYQVVQHFAFKKPSEYCYQKVKKTQQSL